MTHCITRVHAYTGTLSDLVISIAHAVHSNAGPAVKVSVPTPPHVPAIDIHPTSNFSIRQVVPVGKLRIP